MLDFPEDRTKTLYFEFICGEVKKALLSSHKVRETDIKGHSRTKPVYWGNLGNNHSFKATNFSPKQNLDENNLRYGREEQGRSTLDVIIGIAVSLGIEQGMRIANNNFETQRTLLSAYRKINIVLEEENIKLKAEIKKLKNTTANTIL